METLSSPEALEKLEEGQTDESLNALLESCCVLLSYLTDALHAINTTQSHRKYSITNTFLGFSVKLDISDPKNYTNHTQHFSIFNIMILCNCILMSDFLFVR